MCVAWAQEGLVPRDTGFSEHPFQLRGGPPWELADFYHDRHLPPPVRVGWDPPHPLCSMSSHLPPQASSLHLRLCPRFQAGPEKEPGLKRGQNHLPLSFLTPPSGDTWAARRAGCGASLHGGKMKRWGLGRRRKDRGVKEKGRGLGAEQEHPGLRRGAGGRAGAPPRAPRGCPAAILATLCTGFWQCHHGRPGTLWPCGSSGGSCL